MEYIYGLTLGHEKNTYNGIDCMKKVVQCLWIGIGDQLTKHHVFKNQNFSSDSECTEPANLL